MLQASCVTWSYQDNTIYSQSSHRSFYSLDHIRFVSLRGLTTSTILYCQPVTSAFLFLAESSVLKFNFNENIDVAHSMLVILVFLCVHGYKRVILSNSSFVRQLYFYVGSESENIFYYYICKMLKKQVSLKELLNQNVHY